MTLSQYRALGLRAKRKTSTAPTQAGKVNKEAIKMEAKKHWEEVYSSKPTDGLAGSRSMLIALCSSFAVLACRRVLRLSM